jgi:hypothetical protein
MLPDVAVTVMVCVPAGVPKALSEFTFVDALPPPPHPAKTKTTNSATSGQSRLRARVTNGTRTSPSRSDAKVLSEGRNPAEVRGVVVTVNNVLALPFAHGALAGLNRQAAPCGTPAVQAKDTVPEKPDCAWTLMLN